MKTSRKMVLQSTASVHAMQSIGLIHSIYLTQIQLICNRMHHGQRNTVSMDGFTIELLLHLRL